MTLAIIDATIGDAGPPFTVRRSSRYAMPIANSPLLVHVLEDVAGAGAGRARIVTGAAHRLDLERLLTGSTHGLELSDGEVPAGGESMALLSELADALASEPVLFHPGDGLFGGQIAAMCERFMGGDVAAVISADAARADGADASKWRVSDQPLLLGPQLHSVVVDVLAHAGDGADLVEALRDSGHPLAECAVRGAWRYDESTEGLLAANRLILDALEPTSENEELGEGNELRGRVRVAPGTEISNCVVHGPVAIADSAVLEDSFVGPYTALGPDTILSGAEIDNAMVLAGAEIRQPGSRISASIVGERAQIRRSFELPRGLQVALPARSSIKLS